MKLFDRDELVKKKMKKEWVILFTNFHVEHQRNGSRHTVDCDILSSWIIGTT